MGKRSGASNVRKLARPVCINARSMLTWEMFLGILLTGLSWLANFLSDGLPSVVVIFLDRIQQGLAL